MTTPEHARDDTGQLLLGYVALERVRQALQAAITDPALESSRAALLLESVELIDETAYERIDEIEKAAVLGGYPELR